MIVGVESQIITWGLTMEFNTEELKPLADRLAEMVSRELANGTEDATVRDIETAMRRQLLKMGRLALGEFLSQTDVNRERSIACDCPVAHSAVHTASVSTGRGGGT